MDAPPDWASLSCHASTVRAAGLTLNRTGEPREQVKLRSSSIK
jgi:hypothetical protein